MTPNQAACNVGNLVLYRPRGQKTDSRTEEGVITSTNERWAFVRYGADVGSRATDPADLTLASNFLPTTVTAWTA